MTEAFCFTGEQHWKQSWIQTWRYSGHKQVLTSPHWCPEGPARCRTCRHPRGDPRGIRGVSRARSYPLVRGPLENVSDRVNHTPFVSLFAVYKREEHTGDELNIPLIIMALILEFHIPWNKKYFNRCETLSETSIGTFLKSTWYWYSYRRIKEARHTL